jgi:hypothetical protein
LGGWGVVAIFSVSGNLTFSKHRTLVKASWRDPARVLREGNGMRMELEGPVRGTFPIVPSPAGGVRTTAPGVPRAWYPPAARRAEDADAAASDEDGGRRGSAAGGGGRPHGGRLGQVGAAQRGGHGVPDHPADAVPGAEVLPQSPVPGGRAAVGPGEPSGPGGGGG